MQIDNPTVIGTLAGTSSIAVTSSFATTASFVATASTAISSSRTVTASFAITASTTQMEYAMFGFNDIPIVGETDMTPVAKSISSGITLSGNNITLAKPGIYFLQANIAARSSYYVYKWVNSSNTLLSETVEGVGISANSADNAVPSPAVGIVTITSPNTIIKLRAGNISAPTSSFQVYSSATIIQIR